MTKYKPAVTRNKHLKRFSETSDNWNLTIVSIVTNYLKGTEGTF